MKERATCASCADTRGAGATGRMESSKVAKSAGTAQRMQIDLRIQSLGNLFPEDVVIYGTTTATDLVTSDCGSSADSSRSARTLRRIGSTDEVTHLVSSAKSMLPAVFHSRRYSECFPGVRNPRLFAYPKIFYPKLKVPNVGSQDIGCHRRL